MTCIKYGTDIHKTKIHIICSNTKVFVAQTMQGINTNHKNNMKKMVVKHQEIIWRIIWGQGLLFYCRGYIPKHLVNCLTYNKKVFFPILWQPKRLFFSNSLATYMFLISTGFHLVYQFCWSIFLKISLGVLV